MALKATIYKANIQIADMDRHYYADHALIIARHPSENDERMMVRLLAFVLYASDSLEFGKGISSDDEPDLWQKDLTGAIQRWIEIGQPDERRLLKACGRSDRVDVISHGSNSDIWWSTNAGKLERARNLRVLQLPAATATELSRLAERTMQLQATVQEGQIWLGNKDMSVLAELRELKAPQPV